MSNSSKSFVKIFLNDLTNIFSFKQYSRKRKTITLDQKTEHFIKKYILEKTF